MNKSDWADYNIWIRNCQKRRKENLAEFSSLADFYDYLSKHPIERLKCFGLKKMIELKRYINQIK